MSPVGIRLRFFSLVLGGAACDLSHVVLRHLCLALAVHGVVRTVLLAVALDGILGLDVVWLHLGGVLQDLGQLRGFNIAHAVWACNKTLAVEDAADGDVLDVRRHLESKVCKHGVVEQVGLGHQLWLDFLLDSLNVSD